MASIEFDQTDERHELRRYPLWPWIELVPVVSYTTTAPGISTLTMVEDLTGRIVPGCAIRFTLIGVPYYAICTAIAANLLTIAGAPFTLGAGDVDGLWYSPDPGMCVQYDFFIQGNWADGADANLIQNDQEGYVRHQGAAAYLVKLSHRVDTPDSGGAQPRVQFYCGGNAICSSNGNTGRAVGSPSAWVDTVTDLIVANYAIAYEESFEIGTGAEGANNDSADLGVSVVAVFEA